MSVNEKLYQNIAHPRVAGLARYQDLDSLVTQFFSDGKITDAELKTLDRIDDILTDEFQVAQDYLSKMDPNAPLYDAAKELVNYLYRCRNLIDAAHDKAKVYNQLDEAEKRRMEERAEKKETLNLSHIGSAGIALVLGLMRPEQRLQAEESFSKRAVRVIAPAERAQIEQRLLQAMQALRTPQADVHKMNQILALGVERTR